MVGDSRSLACQRPAVEVDGWLVGTMCPKRVSHNGFLPANDLHHRRCAYTCACMGSEYDDASFNTASCKLCQMTLRDILLFLCTCR